MVFVLNPLADKTLKKLEQNLFAALVEHRGLINGKRILLPLEPAKPGEYSLKIFYTAAANAINHLHSLYPTEARFLVVLPTSEEGRRLFRETKENASETAEQFIRSLQCKFYLAGSIWEREDQSERFFDMGIWETGYDDGTYSDVINEIAMGDVIILKSTYAKDSISYLRVKALGRVTSAASDGATIGVDWRVRDLQVDIPSMGYYRQTISLASEKDTHEIFTYLDGSVRQPLRRPVAEKKRKRIASLSSDSEKGLDHLNLSEDIDAFARVLASKNFQPPLAIALLGKWGSGKSFFMQKLKDRIVDFSQFESKNLYCSGVVHIHFNAWSYMDANLWASFVNRIFEGLNDYINDYSRSEDAKKMIRERLVNAVESTKVKMDILKEERKAIDSKITQLTQERETLDIQIKEKIKKIEEETVKEVLTKVSDTFQMKQRINEALKKNSNFVTSTEEFKSIVPERYWENPDKFYKEASSARAFLRAFSQKGKIGGNLIWLVGILLIILLIPLGLRVVSTWIGQFNAAIPQSILSFLVLAGASWKRGDQMYRKLQPVLNSFWKIKEDFDQKKETALAEFEQREKTIKFEINKEEAERLSLDERIQKAKAETAELDFLIKHSLSTETLYSFIDKRTRSDDYQKHLGIVSIIRKDLETLNGLFTDYQSEQEFIGHFTKPLERIILYVDDLDRCPEDNVVQVLEAVNLLMAFPLFIVVVGVDPRWVKNALIKRHATQFNGQSHESVRIEPEDYLEKIFQIPFHLKDATTDGIKNMIRQLALPAIERPTTDKEVSTEVSEETTDQPPHEDLTAAPAASTVTEEMVKLPVDETELLELTTEEVEWMEELADIIGPNPRAIKRFVNIFKIIKAHEGSIVNSNPSYDDTKAILFLLALSVGHFRYFLPDMQAYIGSGDRTNNDLAHFIGGKIQRIIDLPGDFSSLSVESLMRHLPFITRFTFRDTKEIEAIY